MAPYKQTTTAWSKTHQYDSPHSLITTAALVLRLKHTILKMSRKCSDPMLRFVDDLIDQSVSETDLLESLKEIMGKNKATGRNKDIVTSYRYNDDEKNKHKKFRQSDSGESLLHIAVSLGRNEVAKEIIKCDPNLINCSRLDDDYRGQTPFHIAIATATADHSQQDLLKHIITTVTPDLLKTAIDGKIVGKKLKGTVMLGGTSLSIAALKNVESIVNLLLQNGADLKDTDNFGNTVFHSLVLYASFHPEKENNIISMFEILEKKGKEKKRQYLQLENYQRQTALHLAAELGLEKVFQHILEIKHVYKFFTGHDGVFDIYECDITEIDKVTWVKTVLQKSPDHKNTSHRAEGLHNDREDWKIQRYWKKLKQNKNQSILETICSLKTAKACEFLNDYTVQEVVYLKWEKYWRFYYAGLILHILLMSVLTYHSACKLDVIHNAGEKCNWNFRAWNSFSIIISLFYIILEFHRTFLSWQPFHMTRLHHNGVYRLIFLLFGLALLIDASSNVVTVTSNYCLVIALLLGWWSTTFFLRGIRPLTYLTLMLQKVLFVDMLKFIPIIFIMFLAFTSAMHSSMVGTEPGNEAFANFTISLVTMFKMMTGHEEVSGLQEAWMQGSIPVFVLSVIFFQMFLLNVLIAIMSDTCSNVKNSENLLRLQRLSIVLFIEDILPAWTKEPMGEEKNISSSTRYHLKIDRLRVTDMNEEDAITLVRNFIKNKSKVEEVGHDVRAQPVQYLVVDNYGTST
ncbi:transient receptor potential cation channel subfamily V member 5-like [Haliotis rufescens]|uniref:transient receptor potential cation channel subfamily V member 5-like n=1 Tax=Haliotis rufescens TaxID=6454 RepID=UPI00201EE346|nr:transient receptor potential cation channel subfamily V member 5-like [Haliotis rufescens]